MKRGAGGVDQLLRLRPAASCVHAPFPARLLALLTASRGACPSSSIPAARELAAGSPKMTSMSRPAEEEVELQDRSVLTVVQPFARLRSVDIHGHLLQYLLLHCAPPRVGNNPGVLWRCARSARFLWEALTEVSARQDGE